MGTKNNFSASFWVGLFLSLVLFVGSFSTFAWTESEQYSVSDEVSPENTLSADMWNKLIAFLSDVSKGMDIDESGNVKFSGNVAFGNYSVDANQGLTTPTLYSGKGEFGELCIGLDCKTAWPTGTSSTGGITEELDPKIAEKNLDKITVTSDGNLGVGTTTNPTEKLEISGNAKISGTISASDYCDENGENCKNIEGLAATAAGQTGEIQFNNNGDFWTDADFSWDNLNKRLGIGTPTPSSPLTVISDQESTGGGNQYPQALFGKNGAGSVAIGTHNGQPSISGQGTGTSHRLLLNPENGGNVGIGTSNPGAKLDIHSSDLGNNILLRFFAQDGTYNPRVFISHNTSASHQDLTFDSTFSTGSGYSDFLFLNGKVGIGTTEPQEKLDVSGNISSDDRYYKRYVVNTASPLPLVERDGSPIASRTVMRLFCTVEGTNASGTSQWMLHKWANDTISLEKIASFGSETSNTPEIFNDNGVLKIRLYNHTLLYTVKCLQEKLF